MKLPLEVEDDMKRGMLSVKRTEGTFNGVSPDLALEQSQNRSSAVTGGLIGINALHLHLLRASAQTYVWINADQTLLEPIDYTLLGYEKKDDKLYPRQLTKPPLPELLIQPSPGLLLANSKPEDIMAALEKKFGRPEQLVHEVLKEVKVKLRGRTTRDR
ncbi:hypothetical protein EVAR_30745_1 [Eumeta japonica]|uniref:Uncharacterized protein n=1 Tax=Eumeta variegata TaxID=151549 RepID=A0A4C1V792_EUMVA|nr:hypothetical protein EVAR_30745_1 [Eumeta japonica]